MIGIHDSAGSYSDRWFAWCEERKVPYKRLNCLSTDIVQQCAGLRAVLWHWTLVSLEELLLARQIIAALEQTGSKLFPNSATCWHYDDKAAQKYLLEAVGVPRIPTWVFTNRTQAMEWIQGATWPKVFKLRCGASSDNVRLVSSRSEAEALCRRAFGRGFPAAPGYFGDARSRLRHTLGWADFWAKVQRMPRSIQEKLVYRRRGPRQQGYVLFQEFLPGNDSDTRVTVIGNRAFGERRRNRPNDFRASGSGDCNGDPRQIDLRCVKLAFELAEKIGSQSLSCDLLFDENREPRICEFSYCSVVDTVYSCPGYWDRDLRWHPGRFLPQDLILGDLLATLGNGV